MFYTDDTTAGARTGLNDIILNNRSAQRRNGRENSADGTGPEETCKRQGGANGVPCCCLRRYGRGS